MSRRASHGPPDPFRGAEDQFLDAVGSAIEFWGFKRVFGHVWAWLYLVAEERTAADIGERLGLSKAAVSTALAELERWGCVHRVRPPGDRRERLLAESDVWRMVSRVFREREMRKIEQTLQRLDGSVRSAREAADRDPATRPRLKPFLARVERITALARVARATMQIALERGRADVRPLQRG